MDSLMGLSCVTSSIGFQQKSTDRCTVANANLRTIPSRLDCVPNTFAFIPHVVRSWSSWLWLGQWLDRSVLPRMTIVLFWMAVVMVHDPCFGCSDHFDTMMTDQNGPFHLVL